MSIRLAYPTLTAPTVTVDLDDVEELPISRPRRVYQTAFDTDAGNQLVYDWGTQSRAFPVTWTPLTQAKATEIENFYRLAIGSGGVNGRVGVWEYRDSFGAEWKVRFAVDVIEPIRFSNAFYSVSVVLRVVP